MDKAVKRHILRKRIVLARRPDEPMTFTNSLVFGENGRIIARKGGIRRYIQSEIPDLYKSYKTLMRYKALARRFRQAVGICDPVPAASVLPDGNENMDEGASVDEISQKCEKASNITGIKKNEAEVKGEKVVENMVRLILSQTASR